jgi:Zn-dependent protease with chaperone function
MSTSGAGIFYDGATTERHDVTVEAAPAALRISATNGTLLAAWPYDQIETLSSPDGVLRIGLAGSPILARLEIRDLALCSTIDDLSVPVDRSGRTDRRMQRKVAFWSVAATASLLVVAVVGVPAIATQLAPLVPYRVERLLGNAVDKQVRSMLDDSKSGQPFECGQGDSEKAGQAAFGELVGKLEKAAALPIPLNPAVVRKSDANAFALPGGRIYVFQGLVDKSETPDELAGVLAHEIGHVAHRDGTRSVLQAAGLSFLFGMLLGDFVGGGAVIIASKTVLQSSYSRNVEASADAYGVDLMIRLKADPHALAAILKRIAGDAEGWSKLLLDHPETKDRIAAIEAAPRGMPQPLLDSAQWADLKRICAPAGAA